MHAILAEDPPYAALLKRRAGLAQQEREFDEKCAADRRSYQAAVEAAALSGGELPEPPTDPGRYATMRFQAERQAIESRLEATLSGRADDLQRKLEERQAELLAEVRDSLVPRLEEIAQEISELGRTYLNIGRAVHGPMGTAHGQAGARTSVQGPEELIYVAVAGGDFLHWENGMGQNRTFVGGMAR